MTTEETWDYLIEAGIATENELKLVTELNGYREDVLLDVLFARTGYHTIKQYQTS